ncbi:MAG: DUF4335 domain-containing protein [Elainellaceae cyanobacterium]
MTIQRHYDLPNCRLVVEGWTSDTAGGDGRPVLSMVTNAECHVAGHSQPLRGGRDFLQALALVVSTYAQGILSNIPRDSVSAGVRLDRLGLDRHRLIVQPFKDVLESDQPDATMSDATKVQQLDLTTVQLFDLVEAVDQLVADAQTLPDLVLPLSPVSRRSVAPQEPVSRRIVPMVLGTSGFAAAAIALFFVPTPEFRPGELERDPVIEELDGSASSPDAVEGGSPGSTDLDEDDLDELEPESVEPSSLNSEDSAENETTLGERERDEADRGGSALTLDGETSGETDGTANGDPDSSEIRPNRLAAGIERTSPDDLDEEAIDELFTNAVPLSDVDQIDAIVPKLRENISQDWDGSEGINEDLIYRIGTNGDGTIIGFKYVNDAALEYVAQTPLLDLTQLPQGDRLPLQPIGQFRVVLRPSGVVEVSPWYGRPVGPNADAE